MILQLALPNNSLLLYTSTTIAIIFKIVKSNLPFLEASLSLPVRSNFISEEYSSPSIEESTSIEGVETDVETTDTFVLD